jgi:hypothetical protein
MEEDAQTIRKTSSWAWFKERIGIAATPKLAPAPGLLSLRSDRCWVASLHYSFVPL